MFPVCLIRIHINIAKRNELKFNETYKDDR